MRLPAFLLLVGLLLGPSGASEAAELVLIVNPSSGVRELSRDQAANIFMGRSRQLPSGVAAMPIDIAGQSAERKAFYQWLLRKSLAEIDAYWARLVFSGQTSPPLAAPDSETAVNLVAKNRNGIAYVNRRFVTPQVRVVATIETGKF